MDYVCQREYIDNGHSFNSLFSYSSTQQKPSYITFIPITFDGRLLNQHLTSGLVS